MTDIEAVKLYPTIARAFLRYANGYNPESSLLRDGTLLYDGEYLKSRKNKESLFIIHWDDKPNHPLHDWKVYIKIKKPVKEKGAKNTKKETHQEEQYAAEISAYVTKNGNSFSRFDIELYTPKLFVLETYGCFSYNSVAQKLIPRGEESEEDAIEYWRGKKTLGGYPRKLQTILEFIEKHPYAAYLIDFEESIMPDWGEEALHCPKNRFMSLREMEKIGKRYAKQDERYERRKNTLGYKMAKKQAELLVSGYILPKDSHVEIVNAGDDTAPRYEVYLVSDEEYQKVEEDGKDERFLVLSKEDDDKLWKYNKKLQKKIFVMSPNRTEIVSEERFKKIKERAAKGSPKYYDNEDFQTIDWQTE